MCVWRQFAMSQKFLKLLFFVEFFWILWIETQKAYGQGIDETIVGFYDSDTETIIWPDKIVWQKIDPIKAYNYPEMYNQAQHDSTNIKSCIDNWKPDNQSTIEQNEQSLFQKLSQNNGNSDFDPSYLTKIQITQNLQNFLKSDIDSIQIINEFQIV